MHRGDGRRASRVLTGGRARALTEAGGEAWETLTATARERGPHVLLACDHLLRYTVGLANGLAAQGCHVALLARTHDRDFGGEPGAMQAYLDSALDPHVERVAMVGRVRDPFAWPEVIALRRALVRPGYDVVHLQDSVVTDPRLSWVTGAGGRGYAVTVHDPSGHPGGRAPSQAQRWLRRRLVRNASLTFVHGEAMRDELVRLESPPGPVVSMPLGSEAGEFTPLPEQPSLLFFGRLAPYKGLDLLLDAMPRVWERLPDLRLTIAGRGELPRHQVLRDGRVEAAVGHVPDSSVAELFAAATCVVLPYRQASQSAVGALALQHGRAVVATAVGALPELVTERVGRVVPPGEPGELANALVEVVGTPGLAEQLGRAGAAGSVSWDRVAQMTMNAYARHLPGRAPPGGERLEVLHMGPDVAVGGGMATVVREILASPLADRHSLAFIATWRGPEPLDRLLVFLRAIAGLARWCLRPGRRLVHIHVAARGSVYRKGMFVALARLLRRPVILQLHVGPSEIEEFAQTLGPVRARLVRLAFRLPQQVVSVSSAGAEAVHRRFGIDDVVVLPNAVPAAALAGAQAPREVSDSVRMLYVGGFRVAEKGGAILLRALAGGLDGEPRIQVALAGPGELPPAAQAVLESPEVEWLGWLDAEEMRRELRRCDIFVLPSLSEGLPVALLEAMAHGAAIVATSVGAVPATLTADEDALLVPPGDPAALAKAVQRVAQDAALRARLGTAARARAAEHSHDKVYPRLEALYRDVAAR